MVDCIVLVDLIHVFPLYPLLFVHTCVAFILNVQQTTNQMTSHFGKFPLSYSDKWPHTMKRV